MAVDCQNIYKNARKSAGMTQEKAAQLLNVSVDSLRDYEQSQRPVPSDVASAMCDVYQAPYLAVQHLRRSSELGKRVVPEIQLKDLPEAVLSVLAAVQRFIVKRDAMIEIVADGKIEEDEQAEWNEIMDRMNNLFVAMEERGRIIWAMMDYKADEVEPQFDGNERYVWPAIKNRLDAEIAAYERKAATSRENGAKGGRPPKPKETQENPLGYKSAEESEGVDEQRETSTGPPTESRNPTGSGLGAIRCSRLIWPQNSETCGKLV